jgi:inner membrane protein
MGYIILRAARQPIPDHNWPLVALYLFAANLPDVDFLPGLFVGDLARFHHGPSHSIAAAMLFGLFASRFFLKRVSAFATASGLYLSHLLLDYLVQDPSPPYGVPLFWPFTNEYYMAPFAFYRSILYPRSFAEPVLSIVFSVHNFLTIFSEIVMLLPVLAVVLYYKKPRLHPVRSVNRQQGERV